MTFHRMLVTGLPALLVGLLFLTAGAGHADAQDTSQRPVAPGAAQTDRTPELHYENLTAEQLTRSLQRTSLVYFPIGSLEFHGPHLPLGTDSIHAHEYCLRAAARTGGVVLPATHFGTQGHEGWPGSLLISDATFRALVRDVFALLCQQKVKLIVATTGHWPARQGAIIAELADECTRRHPQTKILVLDPYACHPQDKSVDHGGKKETSFMLALRPELVHMERLRDNPRAFDGIGRDAVDGDRKFGEEYIEASLKRYAAAVKAALDEHR